MGTPPFACGGHHEPPCPPTPAGIIFTQGEDGTQIQQAAWTREQVEAYGQACYDKGRADA